MTTFEVLTLILGGLSVLLTGVYVFLTLRIANKTAESVKATQDSLALAGEQLEINKQQSKEAAMLSEKQSQATIDAVNKQIEASERQAQEALAEGRRQSQEALALAHEQIGQGKQPILIPLSALPLTAVVGQLDYTHSELPLVLMIVGTGVALNIWGVLVPPQNIPQTPYSFSNQAHLLQSKEDKVIFRKSQSYFFTEKDKIGELDLRPSSELTKVGTIDVLRYAARLTLTYIDVFGIKHATIYDYTNANEWKVVAHFRVQHDLEDMYKEKKFSS